MNMIFVRMRTNDHFKIFAKAPFGKFLPDRVRFFGRYFAGFERLNEVIAKNLIRFVEVFLGSYHALICSDAQTVDATGQRVGDTI